MKLRVVGGFGGELPGCRSTTFLVDDQLALDAGSLSSGLSLPEQIGLDHIFLSHSHADHCLSLTYLGENVFGHRTGPTRVYGSVEVVDALHRHLLNNVLWPDMACPRLPVFELVPLRPYQPVTLARLTITPVPVPHTVPCSGVHVDDGRTALLYAADMGPTEELWRFANQVERLDALLIECSFPNRLQGLAEVSLHLTPRDLAGELAKLRRPVQVFVYHIKPPHWDEVVAELAQLGRPLTIVAQDGCYSIG